MDFVTIAIIGAIVVFVVIASIITFLIFKQPKKKVANQQIPKMNNQNYQQVSPIVNNQPNQQPVVNNYQALHTNVNSQVMSQPVNHGDVNATPIVNNYNQEAVSQPQNNNFAIQEPVFNQSVQPQVTTYETITSVAEEIDNGVEIVSQMEVTAPTEQEPVVEVIQQPEVVETPQPEVIMQEPMFNHVDQPQQFSNYQTEYNYQGEMNQNRYVDYNQPGYNNYQSQSQDMINDVNNYMNNQYPRY